MDAPSAWRRFMKKAIKLTLYPDLDNCKVAKKSGGRQRTQMKKHDSKENKVVERSSTSGLQDATVAFLNKEDIKTPLSGQSFLPHVHVMKHHVLGNCFFEHVFIISY